MHNNIMEAGSRDRPPMLATGRYPQRRSRFLRYIDTRPNGDALRKCILNGPYIPTTVLVQVVAATDDSPAIHEHTTVETPLNMSPTNKAQIESEKEAIHLILTGIRDEIYSTVDACQTAQEMWEAIKRLQQGESLNTQYPEWSRFVTIVKQQHKLDEVSYHKLFDILKQYQKEVNELRAERLAMNANPLTLIATAQANQDPYYQTSKSHKSYAPSSKPSIPTRSHTTTRYKGKEIAKPITPPFESASEEDIDPEQAQRDKDMQKNLALIAKYFKRIYKPTNNNLITSSNSRNKNVDTTPRYKNDNQSGQFGNQRTMNVVGAKENVSSLVVQQSRIQCFNCKEFGHFAKECRKPKRVKDSAYHKEKMLLCKQAEKGVPLQGEKYDWLKDTDEEIDKQELEAHYSYMAKIQEVPIADTCTDSEPLEHVQKDTGYNVFSSDLQHSEQSKSISNTCIVETDDSNVIPDLQDMCDDVIQNDQNDVESDDERVVLANLIANLKLDAQSKIPCLYAFPYDQSTHANRLIPDGEEALALERDIRLKLNKDSEIVNNAWVKHTKDQFRAPTAKDMDILIKTCLMPLSLKTQNDSFIFVHELKQEMHADLKYVKSLENEIEKLEYDKAKFSNMYDMILQERKSVETKFDKPSVVRQPNAQRIPKLSVLVDSDHFACVIKMLNDVNARTKKPNVVPISTRKPKGHANKSVTTPHNKKVASKSTTQKPKSYYKMLYKKTSKIVQLILFIIDSGCMKHMMGNLKLCYFVEKFMGIVHFGSDQFAPILGYGDLVQGNITINRVYYIEGLNHNLFSVGQFCDADLEKDVVIGLPKLKHVKDQLCSSCKVSKAKRSSFKSKAVPSTKRRLNFLHMDLCGPMRVASLNGTKYIL
nr:integrase, catalytic region, zinc finger, CCHC-type, peptidase aspartic, catalytic [Tanacetum cinerariifolium]